MRVSALLYTLCAAGMRRGTLRCMPLQVRSAALRRIHAAHNIKVYRKACMERSAHGVQLSRSAHAHCTARRNARSAYMERSVHAWAQLSRSTYAHCAPRRSALPCGQNGSCRRHMLCPLCAQHSMLHALRPMRVALHICAPIYLVCCAACMRHGTLCCMPLQVRSAALRRIYMQRTKIRYPSILSKKI